MGFSKRFRTTTVSILALSILTSSCMTSGKARRSADKAAYGIIEEGQQRALGRTEEFTIERPQDLLRRKLLLEQGLKISAPASLGTGALEKIPHWPRDKYLEEQRVEDTPAPNPGPMTITLLDALMIGAKNSRDYQSRKEQVYTTALSLDLERDNFRPFFDMTSDTTVPSTWRGDNMEPVWGVENTTTLGVTQRLKNGLTITSRLGIDLVKLLSQEEDSSRGLFGDATVTVPLMRGAGAHIVTENLTQAERDVVYAIHDFERFKRSFVVQVASSYLQVLRQLDEVKNAEQNYESLVLSGRRARRLADSGRLPEIQVDQALQDELRARDRWISAQQAYEARLDSLKLLLGLPTDAYIQLDRSEFERLAAATAENLILTAEPKITAEEGLAADAPVHLIPASDEGAGPLELPEDVAIDLAFKNRLDLRTAIGQVYDAQRRVVVAADLLRPDVTLGGSGSVGSRRSLSSAGLDGADIRFDEGSYRAFLNVDLPLERTRERNTYRQSLIALEREVRELQQLEDNIKADVRENLRTLLSSRESVKIQAQSVRLAERRVASSDLFLQAGRAQIRDLLEAQEALVSAQNALTAAIVNYRIAELELQRDLDILMVDANGIWTEPNIQELIHENQPSK